MSFICYRREDSSANAGRLFDRLSQVSGHQRVFMDVDGIQPGKDFVEKLERTVGACDAMLVVIGRQWLSRDWRMLTIMCGGRFAAGWSGKSG